MGDLKEVADVTGNVNGMSNAPVKVIFRHQNVGALPPFSLLRGGGEVARDPPLPFSPLHRLWPLIESSMSNVVVGQWLSSVRFFTLALVFSCFLKVS